VQAAGRATCPSTARGPTPNSGLRGFTGVFYFFLLAVVIFTLG
jgi:hypothetical protein